MDSKTIPNFLKEKDFAPLQKIMMSTHFPWFHKPKVNLSAEESDLNSYFTHSFFIDNNINSAHFNILAPLIKAIEAKALIRVVGNLHYKTDKMIIHPFHTDYPFKHKGCLLYINNNNGPTYFKDKIVEAKANRVVLFDPSVPHASSLCDNRKRRVTVNFNYF